MTEEKKLFEQGMEKILLATMEEMGKPDISRLSTKTEFQNGRLFHANHRTITGDKPISKNCPVCNMGLSKKISIPRYLGGTTH